MRARRIGVVGLGVISRFHLAAIDRLPRWELAAVCDVREAARAPFRGRVAAYAGHRALLAHPGLDAVVVTVPNDLHAAVCRDALLAGVPVCVEKPLAVDLAGARALDRLARDRATALFTAFHRRYNTRVRALRDRLPAGARIAAVRVRYLERIEEHIGADTWYLDPRRCGGGCVADNGPNAFDLVRHFLGDVEATAASVVRDARGTDRQAVVDLRATAGGATARVELDWSYPGERKDLRLLLTDGTVLEADLLAGHPGFKASLWHEYVGVLNAFAAALDGGADADADVGVGTGPGTRADTRAGAGAADGLAALELVRAAYALERPGAVTGEAG
ncbi:Gfo/Idh/MocA family protein [Streptomyces apricus]|uniref:Gfo/Idh/MocA family oxidoreductase n=1 Tax=Streptomyces apricus TaxID=1828112 RepID=A0A5A9Z5G8_9ACTN|nr:Gfo/Idh/MocA family oxidoreductase [Streptomyces apricus]KAA0912394.1 Gfo/Idh/MocA family oxidoreductase [Streptomyces apricus]